MTLKAAREVQTDPIGSCVNHRKDVVQDDMKPGRSQRTRIRQREQVWGEIQPHHSYAFLSVPKEKEVASVDTSIKKRLH